MAIQIHNKKKRMPTVLTPELAEKWVKPGLKQEEIESIASFRISPELMSAYTIHKDFRSSLDPVDLFEYNDLPAIDNSAVC